MSSSVIEISRAKRKAVKDSWELVVPIADTASALFYKNLFQSNPKIEELFAGVNLEKQREKLIHAITAVVHSIDNIETMLPMIEELGRRHTTYGVKDTYYDDVGSALLQTLEAGLGQAWNAQLEEAWTEVYTLIAQTMRSAGAPRQETLEHIAA